MDKKTSDKKGRILHGLISITSKGVGYVEVIKGSDYTGTAGGGAESGETGSAANGAADSTPKAPADGVDWKSDRSRDRNEDIEIQPECLHTAMHGDEVEIRELGKKSIDRKAPRMQGEVTRIVERAKTDFVGTIEVDDGKYFLVPDDRRMYKDILLPHAKVETAALAKVDGTDGVLLSNTKVYAKMTAWHEGKFPEGSILKVLGKKGENEVEMQSIVYEKGFETGFPAAVEAEAEHIEETEIPIPAAELAKRRDFRSTFTCTIDPVDAKDFDDAISFKALDRKDPQGNELYEVGVHIADVSHYVREKNGESAQSALDKEASKRGCSIYLVDRTVPMLPEVLSNDICSLNPDVDRLTFSAVFEMNIHGKIFSRWFGKTVIHSHKRFTYETAQASLDHDGKTPDKKAADSGAPSTIAPKGEYHDELTILNTIAKKLAEEKFAAGAIDFEKDEVKFELDPTGKPIRVYRKERLETHKLVEDFMLLANREVAEYIYHEDEARRKRGDTGQQNAFIYRIHDVPDPDKLTDLSIFVRALGYDLESHKDKHGKDVITSKAIRKLLDAIGGSPQEELIKTATIRSMAKAIYSTANIGHFGLGFKYYTHFTSPIRRYPDLLVHRVLFRYLEGKKIGAHETARYETMAMHSTRREILAAEAERASVKYKQVEFMQDKVGQTFDGSITGVTEWGLYVEELETKCEGMIKVRDLAAAVGGGANGMGDFFTLDQKNYCLVGEKTGRKFTLGDKIRFKVLAADMEKKTLDYGVVEK